MRFLKTAVLLLAAASIGCGLIGDKDRIRIARINDRYITRGDLFKIIREMPDEERPNIRNKGDLLRVLNNYIDEQIKGPIADEVVRELQAQGKELVSREAAKQQFFKQHENDDTNYEMIYHVTDASALDVPPAYLDRMKIEIDLRIDQLHKKLLGDAAIVVRAAEAFKNKEIDINEAEYEREYRLRKDELNKFEWMAFRAIRFLADYPGSESEAAAVRRRLDSGESFDSVVQDYMARNPAYVIESEIENNPALEKFRGFWLNASGCKPGDVIGPVYLPEYQVMGSRDAQGRSTVVTMPDAYLVLEVVDHRPPTTLTLEEAKPLLAPHIIVSAYMRHLREQNKVEIYENKLPDPGMFTEQFSGQPLM